MSAEYQPSAEALDFLKRHSKEVRRLWHSRGHFAVLKLFDTFHAEMTVRHADVNREALACSIRNWIEELQPTDLRNRTTAELQDELQRRQMALK